MSAMLAEMATSSGSCSKSLRGAEGKTPRSSPAFGGPTGPGAAGRASPGACGSPHPRAGLRSEGTGSKDHTAAVADGLATALSTQGPCFKRLLHFGPCSRPRVPGVNRVSAHPTRRPANYAQVGEILTEKATLEPGLGGAGIPQVGHGGVGRPSRQREGAAQAEALRPAEWARSRAPGVWCDQGSNGKAKPG